MTDTTHHPIVGDSPETLSREDGELEDKLYEFAYRCHLTTWRMRDEPVEAFANRLVMDLESRIERLKDALDEATKLIDQHNS